MTPGGVARGLACVVTIGLVAAAQWMFANPEWRPTGWWLMLAALLVAPLWQWRLTITDWRQASGRLWGLHPRPIRRIAGAAIVLLGAALWFDASRRLATEWVPNFDRSCITWVIAAAVMSLGFRVAQTPLTAARNRLRRWEWIALVLICALATAYKLGNFENFPPRDEVSQVEELQAGMFGAQFVAGARERWEFAAQAAISGLGIWLGGPTLQAVREAFAAVNLLKVLPAYFWFRALAGPAGALVGTALLAVSGWDSVVNRIPGHPDGFVAMCCFALLAGPAVRRNWAAYPWIGLLAGYSTLTYVAFRPLAGLALAGAFIANLARPESRPESPQESPKRSHRWLRATIATALVASLMAGIFLTVVFKLEDHFANEYFNGWNRAHGNTEYYTPGEPLSGMLRKRWVRTAEAVALFYTEGDANRTHNADGRPQVDPLTGGLMLLGIAYGAVMWWRGFYGLVLAGFAITFFGTAIATSNLDVLRVQATITYVYALAAVGAGAAVAGVRRGFGRIGYLVVAGLLAIGVGYGAYWNGDLLYKLWTSPITRRDYRSDLAYLSDWLRENAHGRRVVGLLPNAGFVVFMDNDASWLRGPDVSGIATWDVGELFHQLAAEHGEVMLMVSCPRTIMDVAGYLESVLPGLHLEPRFGPEPGQVRMAFGALTAPPAAMHSPAYRAVRCTGVRARFILRGENGVVIQTIEQVVPFIDTTTWLGAVREAVAHHEQDGRWIDATWGGEFAIDTAGEYLFSPESYEGQVNAVIDGKPVPGGVATALVLSAGSHSMSMSGRFNSRILEPTARLSWRPPGREEFELIPFYRLAGVDAQCLAQFDANHQP